MKENNSWREENAGQARDTARRSNRERNGNVVLAEGRPSVASQHI
jgi:hypothetical protein